MSAPGGRYRGVMAELDRLLAPYGGLVAYDRRDHPSAVRLNDELRILRGLSVAFPAVFLSIAAFMTQRGAHAAHPAAARADRAAQGVRLFVARRSACTT